MRLPTCDFRIATEREGTYFCRHRRVHSVGNLVEADVCCTCIWHGTECHDPRIVPDDPLNQPEAERVVPHEFPPMRQRVWNLARSLTDFVMDGLKTVTAEQYEDRLKICDGCDRRREDYCVECGCSLSLKARGRAFQCPLQKWPEFDE